jgi:hypothetical protein
MHIQKKKKVKKNQVSNGVCSGVPDLKMFKRNNKYALTRQPAISQLAADTGDHSFIHMVTCYHSFICLHMFHMFTCLLKCNT